MMTFGANRCITIKTKKEMKKNLFMVAAVALMAMVSCNKEEINNGGADVQAQEPSVLVEFTASLGEDATKTTLDAANKKTLWVKTDEISINGEVFHVKELIDGGLSAKFVNKNELPAGFAAPYTALYPANTTEVPAEQTAYAGKFDPTAVLETATSDNEFLSFKNKTSLLKFQVPAACSSVTLISDDALAGSDATTVTISGDMKTGTDYYVAVLPGEKKNFVVRIDGYLSKNVASVNIPTSTIANMKTLPAPEVFGWGLVGQHQEWDITKPTPMRKVADGVYALLDIKLDADGFKFAKNNLQNWNTANTYFGAWKKSSNKNFFNFSTEMTAGAWYSVYTNNLGGQSENIGVSDFTKRYDVYVKVITEAEWGQELGYTVVQSGTKVTY